MSDLKELIWKSFIQLLIYKILNSGKNFEIGRIIITSFARPTLLKAKRRGKSQ